MNLPGASTVRGHEIRDLFINRPEDWWAGAGLFSLVGEEGAIKDIGVVNAIITGGSDAAGLVGINRGTVSNSYSTGSVTGLWDVGGLVGDNDGTVSNSYSIASVTGYVSVGGLVGANGGTMSDSYFTGNITGDLGVGGLAGYHSGTMSNSYYNYDKVLINSENIITIGALFAENFEQWLANDKFLDINERLPEEDGYYVVNNVTDFKELLAFGQNASLKFRLKNDLDLAAEPNFYIPYLAGEFDGNDHKISNLSFSFDFVCHVGLFGYLASGGKVTQMAVENVNITGTSFVGGLVGVNREGTVSNSYSTGSINGSATTSTISYEEDVGGLVGANWKGTVSDSYFNGSVNGFREVGGLVGDNYEGTVSNSYSTGNVTGSEHVGGLVGWNKVGIVRNSYSTGSVNGFRCVGGLAGLNYGTVYNSFWDTETSGRSSSDGGTGKNTTEMKDITTFSGAGWNIIEVALNETNPAYIWNIINGVTYPFLSWQPV
jgi:hypothetical protein